MGLPNVGKSVLFCQLTGMHINASNYVGTTVEYTEGLLELQGTPFKLVDVPGTYGLGATNEAEQVAVDLLEQGPSAVLAVLDAINLESSLHLLLQVLAYEIPTVVVLNRVDLAEKRGLRVDHRLLEAESGVTVVPAVAVDGTGMEEIRRAVHGALTGASGPKGGFALRLDDADREDAWARAEDLAARASVAAPAVSEGAPPPRRDSLVKPWPGIPVALGVMALMFGAVIGIGKGLRGGVFLPFFNAYLFPWIEGAVSSLIEPGMLRNILVGEYGLLLKGIDWPFGLVLPYVFAFYLCLSILEDVGYLPRLAVLLDGLFTRIGLNGSCVIPLLLGYGCGIPAIMATRYFPSRKQRVMVATMVSFAIPCVSQTGAFIALLSEHSIAAVFLLFGFSAMIMVVVGLLMDRLTPGTTPFTLLEVPELLLPRPGILAKKIAMRVRHYILDGAIPMVVAVGFAALLFESRVLEGAGRLLAPLVSGWLNLPDEALVPLILGIVRRELVVLPLMEMSLSTLQLFTGAVVALLYVPCIAMIVALAKEFGARIAVAMLFATVGAALFVGGLVAQFGRVLLAVV